MTAETYTGKPCPRGHTLRYRSNRKCVACHTLEVRYTIAFPEDLYTTIDEARAATNAGEFGEVWRAVRLK